MHLEVEDQHISSKSRMSGAAAGPLDEPFRPRVQDLTGLEAAIRAGDGMKDTRELAFHVVVAPVTRLGGQGKERILKDASVVGFLCFTQSLEKVGYLAHFHMGVGPEGFVFPVLIELMPPFMAAALVTRGVLLTSIIEGEYLTPIVVVVPGQADALASSEESK